MKEAVKTETSTQPPPVSPPPRPDAVAPVPAPTLPPDAPSEAGHPPEPAGAGTAKAKGKAKGITFKGICIFCGERFSVSEEEMGDRSFGFCNSLCRMKFDMDLAEDID